MRACNDGWGKIENLQNYTYRKNASNLQFRDSVSARLDRAGQGRLRGAALKESWYLVSSLKRAAGPDYTTQAGNWGGRVTIYNIQYIACRR